MCERFCDQREEPSWFHIHLIDEDRDGAATGRLQWALRQEGHSCHRAETIDGSGCIEARIHDLRPAEELLRLMGEAQVAGYYFPVTPPRPGGKDSPTQSCE